MKNFNQALWGLSLAVLSLFTLSCKDDDPELREGIQRSELILTEMSGEGVEAHGDHFHGLGNAVDGESFTIEFDENGNALSGGHLHLEADAIYKLELKAWDYTGREVQNDFISSKEVADLYKVFLTGGNFILNPDTEHEEGAIFQPRELQYGDGTEVSGQFETTGITSYFTIGDANVGPTVEVAFVLRKLSSGVKAQITRTDWNDESYKTRFPGEDILDLRFEIHAEEGHGHDDH